MHEVPGVTVACNRQAFSTSSTICKVLSYPENVAILAASSLSNCRWHCALKQDSPYVGTRGGGKVGEPGSNKGPNANLGLTSEAAMARSLRVNLRKTPRPLSR